MRINIEEFGRIPTMTDSIRSKESSDLYDNRTPSGALASYRAHYPSLDDADRAGIYWESVGATLSSEEDAACTLVSAALLAGVSYKEVRERFARVMPSMWFNHRKFYEMSVRDHGLLCSALASFIGEMFRQESLPSRLFYSESGWARTTDLADVPKDCGALVTCLSWQGKHMVACVDGMVYGLGDYAALGGKDLTNMEPNILPMDLVPKVPVLGWAEFRR